MCCVLNLPAKNCLGSILNKKEPIRQLSIPCQLVFDRNLNPLSFFWTSFSMYRQKLVRGVDA